MAEKWRDERWERARMRGRERDVFAVLHYTYKRKEMRSGSKGVVAFCCGTVPTRPSSILRRAYHSIHLKKRSRIKKAVKEKCKPSLITNA